MNLTREFASFDRISKCRNREALHERQLYCLLQRKDRIWMVGAIILLIFFENCSSILRRIPGKTIHTVMMPAIRFLSTDIKSYDEEMFSVWQNERKPAALNASKSKGNFTEMTKKTAISPKPYHREIWATPASFPPSVMRRIKKLEDAHPDVRPQLSGGLADQIKGDG